MKKRSVIKIAIALSILLLTISAWKVIATLSAYRAGDAVNQDLQQYVQIETQATGETQAWTENENRKETEPTALTEPEKTISYPSVDFDSLMRINEDVVGWICIEDTQINYPIVRGEDNREYVSTAVDGTANQYGSIFMDYRNASDFSDRHTVLYGHYMRNGSMFHDIRMYDKPQFYESHPTGMIMTPEGNFQFEVIGGYVASLADASWQLEFANDADYEAWLQDSMERSTIGGAVIPTAEDRLLTLSTCSYEFSNARFVLLCRIIEESDL